jgi:hypothetical protein
MYNEYDVLFSLLDKIMELMEMLYNKKESIYIKKEKVKIELELGRLYTIEEEEEDCFIFDNFILV